MLLAGRSAIVTGAASGLGEGIARRLCAEGARVMIADINEPAGARLAAELGPAACFRRLDIRQGRDWDEAFAAARSAFGAVDLLVNNAAVSIPGSVVGISEEGWRETLDVNCTGTFLGCNRAVAAMSAMGGAIVNIASARGRRVSAEQIAYSCSKALVIRLTEAVALHCAQDGLPIRCNAICPGVVDTPILAQFYDRLGGRAAALEHFSRFNPIGRLGTVEEVASAVAYLASDEASFITGATLDVDGGFRIRDR